MTPSEMLGIIRDVESAANKTTRLRDLGINKATYYLWRRKYNAAGDAGLAFGNRSWSTTEDAQIRKACRDACSIAEVTKSVEGRSYDAVAERMRILGLSFRETLRTRLRSLSSKRCKRCGIEKRFSEFYDVAKESLDGKHVYCKACVASQQNRYRENNRNKINSRSMAYRERLRITHPGKNTSVNREWRRTAKGAYTSLRSRLKQRNKVHLLEMSFTEFAEWYHAQAQQCEYCGITLEQFMEVRAKLPGLSSGAYRLSIDRKDPRHGYRQGNMVLACLLCNTLKGFLFTHADFKRIASRYILPRLGQLSTKS
jgi:hypothetical protein